MMKMELFPLLFGCLLWPTSFVFSQVNDCQLAGVICDNGVISLTSDGPGNDDFANLANNPGCLNEVSSYAGCSDKASFTVRSVLPPNPTILGPSSICHGGEAELSLDQAYTQYAWSTGDTSATITVDQPGLYQVTITSEGGCTSMDTVFLEEPSIMNLVVVVPPFMKWPYGC